MTRFSPATRLAASLLVALASLGGCKDAGPNGDSAHGSDEGRASLSAGDLAPDVTLPLHDGATVKLSELKGQQVLVYFYPMDDTPGCTLEAKGLRDHYEELGKAGVRIFGVSLQDADSHRAFIEKYGLPFPLVVDDGSIAQAFGVPVKGAFTARQSFLVGRDGKLVKVWREVKPDGHAREVLEAAQSGG